MDDWRSIKAIIDRCGCSVVDTGPTGDGEWWAKLLCPSHESRVMLLVELGEFDARDPRIRRLAENIVSCACARTAAERADAIQRAVIDLVQFTPELEEAFSPAWRTVEIGLGDCDDSSRLVYALGRSLGMEVALQTLPERGTRKSPFHVSAVFAVGGQWVWADASLPAQLGEHPMRAAERIGRRTW